MQRREFITLVGGAAASLPLAARAQQEGKVYRIGFLSYRGCEASLEPNGEFRRGLREVGYIEGKNLVLECRDAPGQVERFPDLALQLIRLKLDVLVAEGTPASLAANGPRAERARCQLGATGRERHGTLLVPNPRSRNESAPVDQGSRTWRLSYCSAPGSDQSLSSTPRQPDRSGGRRAGAEATAH